MMYKEGNVELIRTWTHLSASLINMSLTTMLTRTLQKSEPSWGREANPTMTAKQQQNNVL